MVADPNDRATWVSSWSGQPCGHQHPVESCARVPGSSRVRPLRRLSVPRIGNGESSVKSPWKRASAAACVIAGVTLASNAAAQATDTQVRQWLEHEWHKASAGTMPEGVELSFRHIQLEVPPEKELAALREAVRGRPDHPQRPDLEAFERRLASGGDVTHYQLAYADSGLWRVSRSLEYEPEMPFWDTALRDGLVWGLTEQQFTVVEADRESEANRSYAKRGIETVRSAWGRFAFGNFAFGWFASSTPELVRSEGTRWAARAINEAGVICEWRGRWDEELERGFVESAEFIGRTEGTLTSGSEWTFQDWRYWEDAGVWLAGRVERTSDQRPYAAFEVLGVSPSTRDAVAELAAMPDLAGEDPLRGKILVSRVNDYRLAESEVRWLDPSRELVATAPVQMSDSRGAVVLRWFGWAVLLVLLGAFIWLRSRRSQ